MKVQDSNISEAMNWVDYCDALSNECFVSSSPVQKMLPQAGEFPDHAAYVACLQDMVREVA